MRPDFGGSVDRSRQQRSSSHMPTLPTERCTSIPTRMGRSPTSISTQADELKLGCGPGRGHDRYCRSLRPTGPVVTGSTCSTIRCGAGRRGLSILSQQWWVSHTGPTGDPGATLHPSFLPQIACRPQPMYEQVPLTMGSVLGCTGHLLWPWVRTLPQAGSRRPR